MCSTSTRRRRRRCQWPARRLRADRGDPCQRGRLIALIIDAGPLHAYIDRDDRHHTASLDLLETHPWPLIVPTLVVTEVAYLVGTRLGADPEVRFLGDSGAGNLIVEPVAASDWLRSAPICHSARLTHP